MGDKRADNYLPYLLNHLYMLGDCFSINTMYYTCTHKKCICDILIICSLRVLAYELIDACVYAHDSDEMLKRNMMSD